jgi:hypothetical protein
MVFGNLVLEKIFRPKRDKVKRDLEDLITRSLTFCTPPQILFRESNQEERNGRGM